MNEFYDIVAPMPPPAAPLPLSWIIAGAVTFTLLFLAVTLWRRRRTRHRRQALRALQRIRHALRVGDITPAQAAYGVAAALRLAYRTTRLDAAFHAQPGWRTLVQGLDAGRYAPPQTVREDGAALLAAAEFWIRRAPC